MTTLQVTQISGEVLYVRNNTPNLKVTEIVGEAAYVRNVSPNLKVAQTSGEVAYLRNVSPNLKITQISAEVLYVYNISAIGPEVLVELIGDAGTTETFSFNDAYGPEVLIELDGGKPFTVIPNIDGFVLGQDFFASNFFQYISKDLDKYEIKNYPNYRFENVIANILSGSLVSAYPLTEDGVVLSGSVVSAFANDYYNRIHLIPNPLDAGNVFIDKTYTFLIWNSYFEDKTLTAINFQNATGITLDAIGLPVTIPALGLLELTLNISKTGPATINAKVLFTFTGITAPNLSVTGVRIIVLPYLYKYDYSQTKEWLTDVIPTFNKEESVKVREEPRETFSINILTKDNKELVQRFSQLQSLDTEFLGIPIWDNVESFNSIAAGTSVLSFNTALKELRNNDNLIIWASHTNYEIVTISSFNGSSVTLLTSVVNSYGKCYVAPIRIGKIKDGFGFPISKNWQNLTLDFAITVIDTFTSGDWIDAERYQNLPILATKQTNTGVSFTAQRNVEIFNNPFGYFDNVVKEKNTKFKGTVNFVSTSKQEKYDTFRKLDYLAGRLNYFWLSYSMKDLKALSNLVPNTNEIEIEYIGWSVYEFKHIRVTGINTQSSLQTTVNFEIFEVIYNELDGTETIRLSAPYTDGLHNISRIEILRKVRLNSDSIEFNHKSRELMTVSIPVIEVN